MAKRRNIFRRRQAQDCSAREEWLLVGWWLLMVMAALCALAGCGLIAGCGSSEPVRVDPGPSAENYRSDTLRAGEAPRLAARGTGRLALPDQVERYPPLEAPAWPVAEIAVGREHVTVTSPTVRRRFTAPARGERLRIRREDAIREDAIRKNTIQEDAPAQQAAGTAGDSARVVGRVDGEPAAQTVQVPTDEDDEAGAWQKIASLPAWALGLLLALSGVIALYVLRLLR